MRRRAEVVREDRMLAMLSLARMAPVAAVQPARILEPPVPAARRLQQIAADRSHIAQLWRRREAAGFAQRVRDLRIDLKLGQGRAGADDAVIHTARDDPPHVDEL